MYLYRLLVLTMLMGEFFDEPDRFASLLLKPPVEETKPTETEAAQKKKLKKRFKG